jgi:hypothetical protein
LQVDGIWGLGADVIAHGSIWGDTSYMLTFAGEGWPTTSAPSAIGIYWGGVEVDGKLWFLGYVPGIGPGEARVRLAGTTAGSNPEWEAFPPSDLDPDTPFRFLAHLDGTWITAVLGPGGNIEIGSPQFLRTSSDGIHWPLVRVPALRGLDPFDVGFNGAASTDEFVIVQAFARRGEKSEYLHLVSRDARDWRAAPPPEGTAWNSSLACDAVRCVLTHWAWDDQPISYPTPIAWVSSDGIRWTPAETTLDDASVGSGLVYLEATDKGFVGLDPETNIVWLSSPDGLTWRPYQAVPPDLRVPIIDLAVGGDTVVALEQEPDVEPQGAWVGSLAAMRLAD